MTVKEYFERLCLFIVLFIFSFHLLVKIFTLSAVFGLVNEDLHKGIRGGQTLPKV